MFCWTEIFSLYQTVPASLHGYSGLLLHSVSFRLYSHVTFQPVVQASQLLVTLNRGRIRNISGLPKVLCIILQVLGDRRIMFWKYSLHVWKGLWFSSFLIAKRFVPLVLPRDISACWTGVPAPGDPQSWKNMRYNRSSWGMMHNLAGPVR